MLCVGEWVRGNSYPKQILTHKKKHSHEQIHTHAGQVSMGKRKEKDQAFSKCRERPNMKN